MHGVDPQHAFAHLDTLEVTRKFETWRPTILTVSKVLRQIRLALAIPGVCSEGHYPVPQELHSSIICLSLAERFPV